MSTSSETSYQQRCISDRDSSICVLISPGVSKQFGSRILSFVENILSDHRSKEDRLEAINEKN